MATQKQIAEHLDLSERRIADLLVELGLPTRNCDLSTARIAYIRELREKAAGRYTEGDLDLSKERARLTFHQANIAELDEDIKRGKLIPAETVEKVWSDMVAAFRAKILSIPTKSAHQFVAITDLSEIQDVIKEHLNEALVELSEYDPNQYQ
jgi:phage terminase Nu1 subunit (DNA packaging protein)